jgi:Stage III sporulation protein AF (Spore_III_AF).
MNLLGNSSYKKYVGIFTGMVLILIVITPIMKLIKVEDNFSFHLNMEMLNVNAREMDNELYAAADKRKSLVLDKYKDSLKEQITKQLNQLDLTPVKIEVAVEEDEKKDAYGEIRTINITARQTDDTENGGTGNDKKITIEKVKIESKKEENKQGGANKVLISMVKDNLAKEYQLKQEQIHVQIE